MYLLDTDILIYSLKAHKIVQQNLQHHLHDPINISAVTLMELYYGAYKSQMVANNLAKIKTIENALEVIPVNQEMVEIFGVLKSHLEKGGKPLDDFDLILAATAMSHNLIRNVAKITFPTMHHIFGPFLPDLKLQKYQNSPLFFQLL